MLFAFTMKGEMQVPQTSGAPRRRSRLSALGWRACSGLRATARLPSEEMMSISIGRTPYLDTLQAGEILDNNAVLLRALIVELRKLQKGLAKGLIMVVQSVPESICYEHHNQPIMPL